MAPGKENAARLGAHIVFIDESGFLLSPTAGKTWAPRGCTPTIRHWARRDRVSVISALSVSPKRQRIGLCFQCHTNNIRHVEVCSLLRELLRHLRAHVIVIWDGATIHRGEPIREICRRHRRLHLEMFPAYSPELNPDEGVWAQAKKKLANGRPDTIERLLGDVSLALFDLQDSQSCLRACIHRSELPPLLA